MIRLPKNEYWDKIIDYYYDHVFFEDNDPGQGSIMDWVERVFNARVDREVDTIMFDRPESATAFLLRWA